MVDALALTTAQTQTGLSKLVMKIVIPLDLPKVRGVTVFKRGDFGHTGHYQLNSKTIDLAFRAASGVVLVNHDGAHVLAQVTDQ